MTKLQKQNISKARKGKALGNKNALGNRFSLTEEQKRKISIANKGRVISEEHKRKLSKFHKGLKISEKTKQKMSEAQKRIGNKPPIGNGEKNGRWNGGGINYVKRQALERDNYTCQRCGINDKDVLQIDHIIPRSIRNDLVKEISNLVTLCANCHMKKSKNERMNKVYGK